MLQAVAFSSSTLVLIPILLSPRVMVSMLHHQWIFLREKFLRVLSFIPQYYGNKSKRLPFIIRFIDLVIWISRCNGNIRLELGRLEQWRHHNTHVRQEVLPQTFAKPRPRLQQKKWSRLRLSGFAAIRNQLNEDTPVACNSLSDHPTPFLILAKTSKLP